MLMDATSNAMKNRSAKKQIKNDYKRNLIGRVPRMINRMGKIPTYISLEAGFYWLLVEEAKECYILGRYHATIAMVGIAAERFSKELESKIKFKINEHDVSLKKIFTNGLKNHKRLYLLKKGKIITDETFTKLNKIRKIRNDYIHYERDISDLKTKRDSLKILKLFIWIMNFRFSEKYTIKKGKIVKR